MSEFVEIALFTDDVDRRSAYLRVPDGRPVELAQK